MDLSVVMELGELRAPLDIVAALALDRQGLSTEDRPPPREPSQGFLGGKGTSGQGADELAREPRAPRDDGALVLLCHATCMTLSEECLVGPHARWSGWHRGAPKLGQSLGRSGELTAGASDPCPSTRSS